MLCLVQHVILGGASTWEKSQIKGRKDIRANTKTAGCRTVLELKPFSTKGEQSRLGGHGGLCCASLHGLLLLAVAPAHR